VKHVKAINTRTRVQGIPGSPGLWLLLAGLEVLFLIHIAEFQYPGYSVSENYISDLGVGPMPSKAIFTAAVILFGLMTALAAALFRERDKKSWMWALLLLSGIGAIGVGLFNEDTGMAHRVAAFLAFFFGNLAALYSYRIARPLASFVFAVLGLMGLSALGLFGGKIYLGLGIGGMERMILYPAMLWAVGFGAYLIASRTGPPRYTTESQAPSFQRTVS
jgi:hypothetical membrane protein